MLEPRRCLLGTAVHSTLKTWLAASPGSFFQGVRLERRGMGMVPIRPLREGIAHAAVARATAARRDAMVVSVVNPARVRSTESCRSAGTRVRAVQCRARAEDGP